MVQTTTLQHAFKRSNCGFITAGLASNQAAQRMKFRFFKKKEDDEGNIVSREFNSWQATKG